METKSFFGANGLTSTSANHYANLAREKVRKIKSELDSIAFYDTDIRIISDGTSAPVSFGVRDKNAFESIRKHLMDIACYNSLVAFFMEAIKEKERLTNEAKNWEDEMRRSEYNTRKEAHDNGKPKRCEYITAEDVIKSWSVGEQEKYLSLEAQASVYGKFIHSDGKLSEAREKLMEVINNPHSVKENGRDTIIYSFTPTVDLDDVDKFFFELQSKYREIQAELNGMKKRIDDAVRQHALDTDNDFRTRQAEWRNDNRVLDLELEGIMADEAVTRKIMLDEVLALKIVVPNRLQEVFKSLQKLG